MKCFDLSLLLSLCIKLIDDNILDDTVETYSGIMETVQFKQKSIFTQINTRKVLATTIDALGHLILNRTIAAQLEGMGV